MLEASDKFDYYDQVKTILSSEGFKVNPYREINYGLQFVVFYEDTDALLRIYDGKKGLRLDFSQVKDDAIAAKITEALEPFGVKKDQKPKPTIPDAYIDDSKLGSGPSTDPAELIGIDESGKGDFFGPLVVAAVHVDPEKSLQLKAWGIQDSKTMSDDKIAELAPKIKSLCHHSLVIMGNTSYNEVYEQFKNLNHLLAWGHGKVLENTLKHVNCPYALSDQFGRKSLVENALRAKGIKIQLFQRPRAEDNIAVAAASVLARDAFVEQLTKMENSLQMRLPKGCSKKTVKAAIEFCERYGREHLPTISKQHFVLTKYVDEYLNRDEE